jgi:hypothetical protein
MRTAVVSHHLVGHLHPPRRISVVSTINLHISSSNQYTASNIYNNNRWEDMEVATDSQHTVSSRCTHSSNPLVDLVVVVAEGGWVAWAAWVEWHSD